MNRQHVVLAMSNCYELVRIVRQLGINYKESINGCIARDSDKVISSSVPQPEPQPIPDTSCNTILATTKLLNREAFPLSNDLTIVLC